MVLLVSHWLAKDALCDSQLVDEAKFISRSVMHGRGKRGLLSEILAWLMQTWLHLCSSIGLLLSPLFFHCDDGDSLYLRMENGRQPKELIC